MCQLVCMLLGSHCDAILVAVVHHQLLVVSHFVASLAV
jgi:hypothetical protein